MSSAALLLRQAEAVELQELAARSRRTGALPRVEVHGDGTVDVRTSTHDSRRVGPGTLYFCVPGARFDGHDFAAAAVADGAAAVVCERPLDVDAPQLLVERVRAAMGPVAAVLEGSPGEKLDIVGITGTNGKTTTAHLLDAIVSHAGRPSRIIGTLTGTRTTPEAPELQAQLAAMVADGVTTVAMEVSSHALDQHRVDGTPFRVGVFTNLSQDHLDHHGTMEAYFAAKARLFEPARCQVAVLNLDDVHGRLLADAAAVPVHGYRIDDVDGLELDATGSRFRWRGHQVQVGLPGRFNVSNALAALTAAVELGIDAADAAAGLATAGVVAGRFERIEAGQPYAVAVDYAHTPDGLEQVLAAARELTDGRVIVVFGAGGDRDHDKRPLMGEAASQGADLVVLTTDNPRDEDPAAIISAVERGIDPSTELLTEPDRAAAIAAALGAAAPGDVVVVAGKGHETTQTIGADVRPFDDRTVVREVLAAAGHTAEATR